MKKLKINGYLVIAIIRRWEEWTIDKDKDGSLYFAYVRNEQDQLDIEDVEEWTFEGGGYYSDDRTFKTLEELERFLKVLPECKEEPA